MSIVDRGRKALADAESALRVLVAEAAEAGDYAGVLQLTEWARALRDLRADPMAGPQLPRSAPIGGIGHSTATPDVAHPTRTSKATGKRESYPKFFRHGGRVVRVGWSKGEKREYQQQTPGEVFQVIVGLIDRAGRAGRVFTVDELAPTADSDESGLPSYQLYSCIALLRQGGLLDQHGRRGYSICRPAEFVASVNALVASLPEI